MLNTKCTRVTANSSGGHRKLSRRAHHKFFNSSNGTYFIGIIKENYFFLSLRCVNQVYLLVVFDQSFCIDREKWVEADSGFWANKIKQIIYAHLNWLGARDSDHFIAIIQVGENSIISRLLFSHNSSLIRMLLYFDSIKHAKYVHMCYTFYTIISCSSTNDFECASFVLDIFW